MSGAAVFGLVILGVALVCGWIVVEACAAVMPGGGDDV